ncbi:MAG: fibronectin type III-like domain-contianing protein, partial [Bacteroidaceae bacterium]|nr:fibronectin type III-like domain-contianing protein [Bacteroidaceae bacterium]
PGESETLTMSVNNYYLSSFNEATSAYETAAGKYNVMIGASIEDIRCTGSVAIKGQSYPAHKALIPAKPVQEITVK